MVLDRRSWRRGLILIGVTGTLLPLIVVLISYLLTFKKTPQASKGEVLILTLNATGGHMSAANALGKALEKRGIHSDILPTDHYWDPLNISRYYEQSYRTYMGRCWLKVLMPAYFLVSPAIRYRLKILLGEIASHYKCIISVAPFISRVLNLSESPDALPRVIIPTDFSDPILSLQWPLSSINTSPGNLYCIPQWLDSKAPDALYLLGSDKLMEQAQKVGLPHIQRVSGMIIKEEFTTLKKSQFVLRKQLGIPVAKKVVLFLFGSCASSEMVYLMRLLQDSEYYCIFICGKATKIQRQLEKLNVNKRHRVLGFVSNVEEWMKASDVCVGKPGPGVISECVASKIPIVVKNGPDVLVQEEYNIEYMQQHKLGVVLTRWKTLPSTLHEIFQNYAAYQNALAEFTNNNALEEICDIIEALVLREYKLPGSDTKLSNPSEKMQEVEIPLVESSQ